MSKPMVRRAGGPMMAGAAVLVLLCSCTTTNLPKISYDSEAPPLPAPPAALDGKVQPLHLPPPWKVSLGGKAGAQEEAEPLDRVEMANSAARVEPRKKGYFNATQIYAYSPGALYQVYAAPGQITDIMLEEGEQLTGSGPVSAGDTVRWVVGDTESGAGERRHVHILVKPTRAAIETNLIVNTDRRTYLLELRARDKPYMPAVAWYYPQNAETRARQLVLRPELPNPALRRFRYRIEGDDPPWRPVNAYDDGRKVYIEFAPGIVQGELPPLFVIGSDGAPEIVNYRAFRNIMIVDRLFAAAELRLGGEEQRKVRIVRTDGASG